MHGEIVLIEQLQLGRCEAGHAQAICMVFMHVLDDRLLGTDTAERAVSMPAGMKFRAALVHTRSAHSMWERLAKRMPRLHHCPRRPAVIATAIVVAPFC